MDLSQELRRYLVSELRNAGHLMQEHAEPIDRAFYFSAVFGAVQRVFNIKFSERLVLLWTVSHFVHSALAQRLEALTAGKEPSVGVFERVFPRLIELTLTLADRIEADEEFSDVLEAMCALGYSTTGNGFYLHRSGRFSI